MSTCHGRYWMTKATNQLEIIHMNTRMPYICERVYEERDVIRYVAT